MKFIDEAKIIVRAGNGGNGCISFRREAHEPRGGPNGGNGGKGGDVILLAASGLSTLLDLKFKNRFEAQNGGHGMGKDMYGRGGKDVLLRVPLGTVVKDAGSGDLLADLTENGQQYVAARGGRGGRGNRSYMSATNRAPRQAQKGQPGEEKILLLELKVLADVGLIGRPNAGKSTLISRISAARPKIADYPFTTLTPVLGVVSCGERSFTVADIPGLIEGAHDGVGMGIRFLKHIERTRLFLHLLDLSDPEQPDPFKSFQGIELELNSYSPKFKKRKRWVVFTKIDLLKGSDKLKKAKALFTKKKIRTFAISAATGEGLKELIGALASELEKAAKASQRKRKSAVL
jgi:Obg family GTPase CgtA